MSATTSASLLIVDDEALQMKALCNTLEAEGYRTTGVTSPIAALTILREQTFDLVLSDLSMPAMDGIALLQAAAELDPDMVGIVMTGYGTIDTAVKAMQAGALDFILKPFKLSAVLPVVTRALAMRRLRMENIQLREAVGIYKLSMAIAFALDVDTVLQQVADAALEHSWVHGISVLLPTEDGSEMRVAISRGEDAACLKGAGIPFTPELWKWVERNRERLSRSGQFDEIQPISDAPFKHMMRGLSIPLLAGGRFVGILNLCSENPRRPIAPGQTKALNILASAAASAIDRVSLLDRLRRAEQRYRRLTENAPDIVFRYELHPQPCFSYMNPAIEAATGYTAEEFFEDPGLALRIAHPEDRTLMEKVLLGAFPSGTDVTVRWVHRNGGAIWMEQRNMLIRDESGRPVAIECIARDITGRRELEDELRHAQKMEVVGRLAGGIAHDFNNLLTVINGYSDLLLLNGSLNAPSARENIREIKRAGEQAAVLTRQLSAFARKQVIQPRVLNVNSIVETNAKILRRIIGADIELTVSLDADLGSVKADAGQIEQILMNLVVNSRDAMPMGGRLLIETRNIKSGHSTEFGWQVMLAVTDTGSGMDAATQARIFEPFFTTKESGRGTGLGLSIVSGIVKQSEGNIEVASEPGKGTTFMIYLPRIDQQPTEAQGEAALASPDALRGIETILVVEDDEVVRQLINATLEKVGYRVLCARDPREALQISDRESNKPSLILTDLVLPAMSGPSLVEALRALNAGLKVVYMSGCVDDTILRHGCLSPEVPFVQKPFTTVDILSKVRQALDEKRSPALAAQE